MKRNIENLILARKSLFVWLIVLPLVVSSQNPFFVCDLQYSPPISELTEDSIGDCFIGNCGEQSDDLPIVTINYNFHFIAGAAGNLVPDDPTTTADDYLLSNGHRSSELIIEGANDLLENFQVDNLSSASFVGDSRMRVNLYTESSNSDDVHGGIWFWNSLVDFNQATNSSANLYQDKVKFVIFRDNTNLLCQQVPPIPNQSNLGAATWVNLNTNITAYNYQFLVLNDCFSGWPPLAMGKGLVHESFHNLGLYHSFNCVACGNQCGAVDLDIAAECSINNCEPTCIGGENTCDSSGSGSNNIMGQTNNTVAISCCQWETVYGRAVSARPNWVDIENTQLSNVTINNNEDINWIGFYEADNITIKNGGKLAVSGELKMGNRITVEPGGELVIDCALVTNRTAGKWEGIIVEGNSNTHQFEINGVRGQGYCRIKNSIIENATFAVRTHVVDQNDPDFQNGKGGIVVASDSDFKNNRQAISIVKYQNFIPVIGQPYGNASGFSNCTFTIDNDYIGDYLSEFRQHVFLQQVTGIRFNGCDFLNEFEGIQYAHLRRNGIESRDADFFVGALCLNSTTYPCQNYKNSLFSGMGYGINAYNTSSANTFRVTRTNFHDNFVGISAHSVNNIYAVRNNFQVGMSLIPRFPDTYFTGIQLFKTTGYQVEDNDFSASTEVSANDVTIGSAVSGSSREANEIYRNNYDGLMYGNLSNGNNRNNIDKKIGLQYRCNDNVSNDYDFGVDEFSDIAEDQGSANLSAGNCFSNNPIVTESDFRNEAASINYFFDNNCIPTDVSNNVILPLQSSPINLCPSGIPGDERGKLSTTEKQNFQQTFNQSTDAIIRTGQANKLIRDYLIDEENYDWTAARTWLNNKGGLEAHFMIVDSWLYENNSTNAKNALDNIPNQANLTSEENEEYKIFTKLKEMQIKSIDEGISYEKMVETNLAELSKIASEGDLYGAWQAKGMVNSAVEDTYIPKLLLPGSNAQQSIAPNSGVNNTIATDVSQILMAAPNPTNSIAVFTYQLPEELENGTIEIRNLQGQLIEAIQLNGNTGSINWNAGRLANGVYLYSLLAKNKVIVNQRLVITK